MKYFYYFLFILVISPIACRKSVLQKNKPSIVQAQQIQEKASAWLLDQQAEDGGWHSKTHGILKGGAAYTPYIMDALQESGRFPLQHSSFAKGYGFLLQQIDSTGAIGQKGAYVVEYPVYATAYVLKIWNQQTIQLDTLLPAPFATYLLQQQFTEQRGIAPAHPAYGAWGFGEQHLPYGEVGHVDLSHTRRVLEALKAAGFSPTHSCWQQAARFLNRLQNEDGGFCSSTYTLGANKADDQQHTCVSYATATADGLLALLSLPRLDTTRIKSAAQWLQKNDNWAQVGGIVPERPGDWEKVMFFYHLAVRAQACARLEQLHLINESKDDWRQKVVPLLADKQAEDGSFSNPWGAPNKEDDPLLATALALRALNAVINE